MVVDYRVIRDATHEDMIAAQNGAYMRLFSENLKLSASFATLEKAYQTLASGASRQPSASTVDAIDTVTLTPENYPAVRFWYKEDMKDERAKRRIEDKKNGRRGLLFKRKNVNFWFLQNVDGTPVHNSTVSSLRAEAKLIWSGMCEDYGPMGLPWSSVPVKRRMEFWLKLENKYPLLRLCANHYKANSVASEDYTHWHKTRYPNRDGALDSGSTSRKRRRAALPVHARKSQRRGSRSRRVSMLRIEDDDEDDEAVEEVRVGRESNDYEEDDDGDNEVHEGDGEDHEGDDEVHDDESEDRDGDESEDRALVESEDRDSNKFEDHVDEEHDNDGDEVDDGSSNGEDEDEGVNNNLKVIPDPESDATPSTRPKPSEQKLSSLMRGPSNTRVISDVNGDATPPPNPTNESDVPPSPVTARVNPTSAEQTGPVLNLAARSTASKTKENKGKAWATGTIDRRNLFGADYLKEIDRKRGHFASGWEGLEDDIDDTRQSRAVAAKKMKAKGASQK